MSTNTCCVCQEQRDLIQLGDRWFCPDHHARAQRASQHQWSRSGLFELLMSMLYVAAVATWAGTEPLTGWAARGLVVFPCILWMTYIYRQDRLEPEPWPLVAAVALFGAGMTAGVALPLAESLTHGDVHQFASWGQGLVRAVCVVAALFLVVRYTAFATAEFDEPVDALVYAAAAASGAAVAWNLSAFDTDVGVLPAQGATLAVATTLGLMAAVMPMAWGLATYRFSRGSAWVLAASLGLAVLTLLGEGLLFAGLANQGLTLQLVPALGVTLGVSAGFVLVGFAWTSKLRGPAISSGSAYAATAPPLRIELVPWAVLAVLLLVGRVGTPSGAPSWTAYVIAESGPALRLPTSWLTEQTEGRLLSRADPWRDDAPHIEVTQRDPAGLDADLTLLTMEEAIRRDGFGYETTQVERRALWGDEGALWSWYGMARPGGNVSDVPRIERGVLIVSPSNGWTVHVAVPARTHGDQDLRDALVAWGVTR